MTTDSTTTLYYHPFSTTSRPIMMFAAEHGLALDYRSVDLFSGEHLGPVFSALNPNQAVPLLVEGDFRLTESSAILKYLADGCGSAAYPQDRRERARVDAAIDWFNTGLMRDLAYGSVYPLMLPNHRRPDVAAQQAHLDWSRPRAERWLTVLDQHMLGDGRRFLLGEQITLADYFAIGVMTLPEAVGEAYARWPQLRRWLQGLKDRSGFVRTHQTFYAVLAASQAPATQSTETTEALAEAA